MEVAPHLAKRWEPRGFSRVAAAFSSYDGDLSLPLGLALGHGPFSPCDGSPSPLQAGLMLGGIGSRRRRG